MEFEQDPEYFNDLGSMFMAASEDDLEKERSGYLSGGELLEMDIPSGTKTEYYLNQAENRGTVETIENYPEPIAFEIHFSKTDSFWLGTTDDARGLIVDLSRLKLLVQDSQIGKVSGYHTYELSFAGDDSFASKLEREVRETLEGLEPK